MALSSRPPTKFDRASCLFLGHIMAMTGLGFLLEGMVHPDLVFPVGGGFFLLSGIAIAAAGLKQPRRPRPPGRTWTHGILQKLIALAMVGFVFLCGYDGLGARWMGIVGSIIFAPLVIGCVAVLSLIAREVRRGLTSQRRQED